MRTIFKTRFFRHRASLRLSRELSGAAAGRECRRFRALSVGCATGEEVYSLAMLLDTAARGSAGPREFSVTGADISATALQQARSGRYLMRRLAGIPDEFRDRYCRAVSATHFDIVESLRRRVRFAQINVRRQGKRHGERFNLVICQNLLIYYDRARRLEIVDRLAEYLLPGGALILGVGELLGWRHANMEKLCYPDTLAYRRTN